MATFPAILKEVLSESLIHTAGMLPILFAAFVLVEMATHHAGAGWLRRGVSHPYLGPVAAAALGLLPQCGFSVATTSLFVEGLIPMGSLLATYIATSDEAIPILLAHPNTLPWVIPLLATKLVWGSVAGIAVNVGTRQAARNPSRLPESPPKSVHSDQSGHQHERTCVEARRTWGDYAAHAFSRTLRIAAMVFVLSSLFNTVGHYLGATITKATAGGGLLQPLAASFVGLIPSCATSVVLAEGFRTGMISFPALVSGLTANAGLGLLVLLKESRDRSRTLSVIVLLVLSAFISGTLASLLLPG